MGNYLKAEFWRFFVDFTDPEIQSRYKIRIFPGKVMKIISISGYKIRDISSSEKKEFPEFTLK